MGSPSDWIHFTAPCPRYYILYLKSHQTSLQSITSGHNHTSKPSILIHDWVPVTVIVMIQYDLFSFSLSSLYFHRQNEEIETEREKSWKQKKKPDVSLMNNHPSERHQRTTKSCRPAILNHLHCSRRSTPKLSSYSSSFSPRNLLPRALLFPRAKHRPIVVAYYRGRRIINGCDDCCITIISLKPIVNECAPNFSPTLYAS